MSGYQDRRPRNFKSDGLTLVVLGCHQIFAVLLYVLLELSSDLEIEQSGYEDDDDLYCCRYRKRESD